MNIQERFQQRIGPFPLYVWALIGGGTFLIVLFVSRGRGSGGSSQQETERDTETDNELPTTVGPPGPAGPTGAPGPAGPIGPAGGAGTFNPGTFIPMCGVGYQATWEANKWICKPVAKPTCPAGQIAVWSQSTTGQMEWKCTILPTPPVPPPIPGQPVPVAPGAIKTTAEAGAAGPGISILYSEPTISHMDVPAVGLTPQGITPTGRIIQPLTKTQGPIPVLPHTPPRPLHRTWGRPHHGS